MAYRPHDDPDEAPFVASPDLDSSALLSEPLSVPHLAALFECTSKTMLRRLRTGQVRGKLCGRQWRVLLEEMPPRYLIRLGLLRVA